MANDGQDFLALCEKLAEKGSVEHQLFLGRHHYKLARQAAEKALDGECSKDEGSGEDTGEEGGEDESEKAVRWLLDAAKNGSVEATELLHLCLKENIGISSENEARINDYFGTATHKHVKRMAAKKLFKKLKVTADKPVVTKDDFVEAIKSEVELDSSEEKLVKRLASKIEKENVQTEEEFVSVVKKHMKTSSPLYVDTQQYEQTSLKDKVLKYPLKTAEVVGVRFLEGAAMNGTRWLRTFVPYRQIQMMIVFCVYSIISLEALLFVIPLVLFYGAFSVMVLTTLQVLYGKQKIRNLIKWAKILNYFEPEVDANVEETKKTLKIITPFLWRYLISFILALTAFSLANTSYITCPECTVLSLFMAAGMFLSTLDNFDTSIIVSGFLNLIISLPYIFTKFPNIPLLYHLVAVITKPLFRLSLIPGFVLNVSIPAFAYIAIPFVFFHMARLKAGRGLHVVLIPHVVAVSWWHMAVMFFCSSAWLGLLRATAGYALALILFPVTSILILGSVVMVVVKLFSWTTLIKCVTTVLLIALPILFTMWYKSDKRLQNLQQKYKVLLLIVIAIAAILSSMSVLQDETFLDRTSLKLSWKSYSAFCGAKAIQKANNAQLQIRCAHLEGTLVKWRATVASVKISSVENVVLNVLNVLPGMMGEQLKCIYGEPFKPCTNSTENFKKYQKWKKKQKDDYDDDDLEDSDDDDNVDHDDDMITVLNSTVPPPEPNLQDNQFCRYVNFYSSKCHVDQYNYYKFSIKAHVGDSEQTVELKAGNHFRDMCLALRPGSRLKFIGRLQSGLGTSSPTIRVYQMRCTNCMRTMVDATPRSSRTFDKDPQVSFVKRTVQSFGFVFNFFLSPLISFEIEQPV